MQRRFVIEAVLVAIYGQLLVPGRPVEYVIPYSTIMELYELKEGAEPVMPNSAEDQFVREKIGELIGFFEAPFTKKKVERALQAPWRTSPPIPVNEDVTFTIVNSLESAQYGEQLDPVETEIVLTALRTQVPVLTDQVEFIDKVIELEIPVEVFDIEDYEFALEGHSPEEDFNTGL
ncbi:ADP-heptose synthase [Paenibacillus turpanensis]|uniref:ADP-heptose synthase n=1 Tax=Paenibacillus turpanensis TaxID=2689078 RepID=UPI001409EBD5|nr:ADP-heptose synthase [Paenibacillus turpanensis]